MEEERESKEESEKNVAGMFILGVAQKQLGTHNPYQEELGGGDGDRPVSYSYGALPFSLFCRCDWCREPR